MEYHNFIECVADWFESWLRSIKSRIDAGSRAISGEYSFPGSLRVGESPHHYIAELMGAQNMSDPAGYKIRRPATTEKVKNTASFLHPGYQFEDSAMALFRMTAEDNTFSRLTFSTPFDREEFERRINIQLNLSHVNAAFNARVLFSISETANKLMFRDIDLVRVDKSELFFKRISTAIVVKKTIAENELREWLNFKAQQLTHPPFSDVLGMNLGYSVSEEAFALQLLGLTQQDVRENIIDEFIKDNAPFFAKALGCKDALSQKKLQIINSSGLAGDYLQPDYLMLRNDGGYDILDIKKALVPSITVGKQKRLRFSAYVNELIGQLAGYRRYFSLQENAKWAKENLGITVGENPRLVGIVGNHNNFVRERVNLAQEAYHDEITIISYAEVVDLLRKT